MGANVKKTFKESEKGMATLEVVPLLFVFIFMFAYTLGAFGVIHTGIMHSISARTYAFETFRNRTNLVYFRDIPGAEPRQFKDVGNRVHAILAEGRADGDDNFLASERAIRMGITIEPGPSRNDGSIHNQKVHEADELANGKRNQRVEVSPVWIMVQYGICLDMKCGG